MRRLIIFLVIGLVVIAALVALYLWREPKLVAIEPGDGAIDVRAGSPLHLTFSGVMDTDSIVERLVIDPPARGTYAWQEDTLVFTPDQPWSNNETVAITLTRGATLDGFLPLSMREGRAWRFTIGPPRLAYLYPADGSPDIFVFNPLSGESEALTESGGVLDFAVYKAGNAIYFSQRSGGGGSRVFRIDLDGASGADAVLVLDCPDAICSRVSVSPSGEYLAYERTALVGAEDPPYPQVWLLPLSASDTSGKGQANQKGERVADELHQTTAPHWSPVGLLTYYDFSEEAFVVYEPGRGEVVRFPNQTGQQGDWHPSGTSYVAPEIYIIALESSAEDVIDPIGSSHLMLFHPANELPSDLTLLDTLEDTAPVYSPRGDLIAFARKHLTIEEWTPGRQLWLIDPEARHTRQLTDEPFYNHYSFAWSPGGDQIAFVRFNQAQLTELPQVWVIDPASGNSTQIMEGGYAPQWIP